MLFWKYAKMVVTTIHFVVAATGFAEARFLHLAWFFIEIYMYYGRYNKSTYFLPFFLWLEGVRWHSK